MRRALILTVAVSLLALAGVSATDQWPNFRGPQAGVVADDASLPDSWSATENGRQRISSDGSGFTASPWAYNGKIFLLSEDGDTFVVQAGPEFKLLGNNSLSEMTLATPALEIHPHIDSEKPRQ